MQFLDALSYYWDRPRELLDRLASEWDRRRDRSWRSAKALEILDLHGQDPVHELLGVPGFDCMVCEGFEAVWAGLTSRLTLAHRHDASLGTVRAAWTAVRHLRPDRVVETGVARGFTSAVILSAIEANGHGHLWSIDLPEVSLNRRREAGIAVTDQLADLWTLRRGGSRRLLPKLLAELGGVDIFVHDSLHTYANMQFEMSVAWDRLAPGGILLVDDADCNAAFAEFAESECAPSKIGEQGRLRGTFGVARKPTAAI
jgi:hypothetical protein